MIYFNKLTKIPSKSRHCENPVIAEIPSLRGFEKAEAISFVKSLLSIVY